VSEHEAQTGQSLCLCVRFMYMGKSQNSFAKTLSGFDGKATCQLTMISCDAVMEVDRKWKAAR
jgi:hypothetical protein